MIDELMGCVDRGEGLSPESTARLVSVVLSDENPLQALGLSKNHIKAYVADLRNAHLFAAWMLCGQDMTELTTRIKSLDRLSSTGNRNDVIYHLLEAKRYGDVPESKSQLYKLISEREKWQQTAI